MKLNVVPARKGIEWVRLGIRTFLKQPLALAGLFFIYAAASVALSLIPVLGPLVGAVLVPAITLGMMAASRQVDEGRFPMPTILLTAFRAGRERARAMLVLGVLYSIGWFLVRWLAAAISPMPAPEVAVTPEGQVQIVSHFMLFFVLHLPVLLLFWHAPALVHWHKVAPVKSLFFSAVACLRNIGAFMMYAIAWVVLFFGFAILASVVSLIAGASTVPQQIAVPFMLLLVAAFSTSVYFTFRDSFVATDGDLDDPTPPARPQP